MEVLAYVFWIALAGLIVGALARLALPGRDPMTLLETIMIGIAGSFIGGFIWALLFHRGTGGIIFAVLCTTVLVYLLRRARGGGLTSAGFYDRR
jgi:uncharacterized membrane protein YeaQ/YmgE (transglycosylase-associated protein family)